MNKDNSLCMTRKQIYDMVWEKPSTQICKEKGLNYSRFLKAIKENNIPRPSSGYWTKLNLGIDVSSEIKSFTGDPDTSVNLELVEKHLDVQQPVNEIQMAGADDNKSKKLIVKKLSFLDDVQKELVYDSIDLLDLNHSRSLHKVLVNYKYEVGNWKNRRRGWTDARPSRSYQRVSKSDAPPFVEDISEKSLPRALNILNVLFKSLENLGAAIISADVVRIFQDEVKILIVESVERKKHELTRQELKQLDDYHKEKARGRYVYKPSFPVYDYNYTGKLEIAFGYASHFIKDTQENKLEDQMQRIFIRALAASNENRIAREEREEKQRIEEEKRKQERLRQDRVNQEKEKTRTLINEAHDYAVACEIRKYIQARLANCEYSPELKAWVEWAERKADWVDPICNAKDDYLEPRKHGESITNRSVPDPIKFL